MNTITSSIGQALAMDGQNYFKVAPQIPGAGTATAGVARSVPGGAEVAQNIAQNLAEIRENAQEIRAWKHFRQFSYKLLDEFLFHPYRLQIRSYRLR